LIHEIAQEVAHEVFMADDLTEAIDIVEAVTPDLTIFDESLSPTHIRDFLGKVNCTTGQPPVTVVAALGPTSFGEHDYVRAGVSHYLVGAADCHRLHDIAAQIQQEAQHAAAADRTDDKK
jgi:response regulator of citrate/malate metabolism